MAGGSPEGGRETSGVQGRGRRLISFWMVWTCLQITQHPRGGGFFETYPGVSCFLELMTDFNARSLMFSASTVWFCCLFWSSCSQCTKPRLSAADPAAPLPWGLKDFISLPAAAPDKGCLIHCLFQSFL